MGEIAEFFKSDCRVDIVAHHGFTGVHIASSVCTEWLLLSIPPERLGHAEHGPLSSL